MATGGWTNVDGDDVSHAPMAAFGDYKAKNRLIVYRLDFGNWSVVFLFP